MPIKSLILALLIFTTFAGVTARAQLTWVSGGAGGDGTWDDATANWNDGTQDVTWSSGSNATFAGTAGTVTISSAETAGNLTFSSVYTITSGTLTVGANSTIQADANANISSVLAGGNITKTGNGTLTLSAQATYSGSTTVSAGTLRLLEGEGPSILPSSTAVILSGGFIAIETPNQGATQSAGTLAVQASASINFGNDKAVELDFADSSAVAWSASLAIQNFDTTIDKIRFGTSASGLTSAQLAQISFSNFPGSPAQIDASGYVTPGLPVANVVLSNLTPTYDGTPKSATVTTTPSGLSVSVTYNGSATAPTAVGSYAVVATVTDPNYQGSASGNLVIGQATAGVSLGNLSPTYDGTPKSASVTTTPNGLTVNVTYNGSATVPTAAGSYAVVATVSDTNYQGSSNGTLIIAQATAGVVLGNLSATFDGTPKPVTVTTTPSGLTVTVTYNGSSTAPSAIGSYPVVATVNDANYQGSASGTLIIGNNTASVVLGNLAATYDGTPKPVSVTTTPSGLTVNFTYNGSATVPTNVGSYAVVATVSDATYTGSASGTLVISKGTAGVVLGNLTPTYDGTAKPVSVTTTPSGLTTNVTYNGSGTVPNAAGTYAVVATVNDSNYQGSASGTLTIAKATASVVLGNLSAIFDGNPHAVTVTTTPSGLTVNVTYNGSATAPSATGNYTVVATVSNANYQGAANGTLVIGTSTVATVTLSNLAQAFDGTPKPVTVTTAPSGLNVTVTYKGSTTVPTAVGSYAVVATVNDATFTGSASGTLVISKGTATVVLGNLAATYDGTTKPVSVTTTPAGLTTTVTYGGSSKVPSAVGTYNVVATVSNPNYTGSASGTLVISKQQAVVTLGNLAFNFDGKAHPATATTVPAKLAVTFTYDGSTNVPIAAGSYAVVATVNTATATGSASGTLTITGGNTATITFGNLTFPYDGKGHAATATTNPAKMTLKFVYNNSLTAPINVGSYTVTAYATSATASAIATSTLTITPAAPLATTSTATLITAVSARLNGSTTPKTSDTMVHFEWGTTIAYGNSTNPIDVGSGTAAVNFFDTISFPAANLGATYHYRVVAINAGGTTVGTDKTFTALGQPIPGTPTAALGASGADISISINPNGSATSVYFEYGLDTTYGSTTPVKSLGSGKTAVSVFAMLPGLLPNTTYHYRIVMTGPAGTFQGPDQTLTTLGYDTVLIAEKGDAAVGTNSTFLSFGNPVINSNSVGNGIAFLATLNTVTGVTTANNSGIWADNNSGVRQLVARTGSAAPGTSGVFATLNDPVMNTAAGVGFFGKLKVATGQATASTVSGVWSSSSGSVQLVARQGSPAPGTSGTFATFTSLGISDTNGVVFYATLNSGTGITASNNAGIWEGNNTGDCTLLLRLGDTFDGKTVSKLTFMTNQPYVGGQTRSFNAIGDLLCGATFTDKTTGVVIVIGGTPHIAIISGVPTDPFVPGSTFATYGSPIINNDNDFDGFTATFTTGVGGVTKDNNMAIFIDDENGQGNMYARLGSAAPDTAGTFLTLSDIVYDNNEAMAFRGTLKVATGQATASTATGIWSTDSGALRLVARQGVGQAPGCPAGATFATFTQLCLPDRGGAVFIGTLNTSTAAGVTSSNNTGIWKVDDIGNLQLIVRTGDLVGGKVVTSLAFLPLTTPIGCSTRSFVQTNGNLLYVATFSDKSTAILSVEF